jgi:hypothetical protein
MPVQAQRNECPAVFRDRKKKNEGKKEKKE